MLEVRGEETAQIRPSSPSVARNGEGISSLLLATG